MLRAIRQFGYRSADLDQVLARIDEVSALDVRQEEAKRSAESATHVFSERAVEFRDWFMPWKKRIEVALHGRPNIRARLGLAG